MNCPGGHAVGTQWESRTCTPLVCGEHKPKADLRDVQAARAKAKEEKQLAKGKFQPADDVNEALRPKHEVFLERAKVAGLPAGLAGDAALQWSQEKLVEMLPEAVASLQYDLRYGSNKERSEATATVLKANGVAQKEAVQGTAPTIVLHLGDSLQDIPFLQRAADSKKAGK